MSWKERQQLTEAWVCLTGLELELRVWEQIASILTFFCFFFFYTATMHTQCCVVTFFRQLRKVSCCDREKVNWGLVQTTTSQNLRTLCCDGQKTQRESSSFHFTSSSLRDGKWEMGKLIIIIAVAVDVDTTSADVSRNCNVFSVTEQIDFNVSQKKSSSWAFYDSSLSFSSG